jgi:hypothetical protein
MGDENGRGPDAGFPLRLQGAPKRVLAGRLARAGFCGGRRHGWDRLPRHAEAAAIRLLVTFTRQSMSTLTGWIETTAEPS